MNARVKIKSKILKIYGIKHQNHLRRNRLPEQNFNPTVPTLHVNFN